MRRLCELHYYTQAEGILGYYRCSRLYKAISPKLAKQFLSRFKEAVTHIECSLVGFQIKYHEVRTLILKQFPYKIHYFIDNDNKQIVILVVANAYRKPTIKLFK